MTVALPLLLCFPHAGASTMTYNSWRVALAGRYEVRIVDAPGRVGRPADPPARTVAELVSSVAERAEAVVRPPYLLYGHSLGALLAFETARRLTARGAAPALLVVSGRNGPAVGSAAAAISTLPDSEFLHAVDQLDRSMPPLRGNPDWPSCSCRYCGQT